MALVVTFAPGAKSAGDEIDIPSGFPAISEILGATLFKGHAVDEDGTASYTIGPTSVTATKVDANTIKLDANTAAEDLLVLRYIAVGEVLQP